MCLIPLGGHWAGMESHSAGRRFAPSGGNTPAYVNRELSKWAIRSKSELMQALMLSRWVLLQ